MIKFLVFADYHYKKRMYAATISGMEQIMARAHRERVDFVIHAGDFCNDYAHSPELIRTYLQNGYDLPVYGVYGNHELETVGNSMENVTPLLCNRPVHFGDAVDGEAVGYWYTDVQDFRIIGLDTNHSYNADRQVWEHNRPASYAPPAGNLYENSLAPHQLSWLDEVLADASRQNKQAIVVSHACFADLWYHDVPDAAKVRAIFAKYPGTVRLAINGHYHTDHFETVDNVAYFDVNTATNGFWEKRTDYHYDSTHTFPFTDYDEDGNATTTEAFLLNDLRQGTNTWFFKDPISAVVTITDDGKITVEGQKTNWMYGIVPPTDASCIKPAIEDRTAQ